MKFYIHDRAKGVCQLIFHICCIKPNSSLVVFLSAAAGSSSLNFLEQLSQRSSARFDTNPDKSARIGLMIVVTGLRNPSPSFKNFIFTKKHMFLSQQMTGGHSGINGSFVVYWGLPPLVFSVCSL